MEVKAKNVVELTEIKGFSHREPELNVLLTSKPNKIYFIEKAIVSNADIGATHFGFGLHRNKLPEEPDEFFPGLICRKVIGPKSDPLSWTEISFFKNLCISDYEGDTFLLSGYSGQDIRVIFGGYELVVPPGFEWNRHRFSTPLSTDVRPEMDFTDRIMRVIPSGENTICFKPPTGRDVLINHFVVYGYHTFDSEHFAVDIRNQAVSLNENTEDYLIKQQMSTSDRFVSIDSLVGLVVKGNEMIVGRPWGSGVSPYNTHTFFIINGTEL